MQMENQQSIFKILSHYYRSFPSQIAVRHNPDLSTTIISGARLIVPKPFFRSWPAAIPDAALTDENTFVAFHNTILLAGPLSDRFQQFWDGGGNFLSNVPPGTGHQQCGYADLSFTVLLSDKVFFELQPLLEDASTHLTSEREADKKLAEMVRQIRDQAMGRLPPDESAHRS